MEDFWDIAIPFAALIGSMVLAGVLLTRARNHAKPEPPATAPKLPASASKRQRRVLETLAPAPVLLKVYRRDLPSIESCEHETYEFVIAESVPADEATERDVRLVCPDCEIPGTIPEE